MIKRYLNECGTPDIVHLQSSLAGELAIWMQEQHSAICSNRTLVWFFCKKATSSPIKVSSKGF